MGRPEIGPPHPVRLTPTQLDYVRRLGAARGIRGVAAALRCIVDDHMAAAATMTSKDGDPR